eukprot:4136687-Prymnesium_polylepis.1
MTRFWVFWKCVYHELFIGIGGLERKRSPNNVVCAQLTPSSLSAQKPWERLERPASQVDGTSCAPSLFPVLNDAG